MDFLLPKTKISLSTLSYSFQKRLIALAPFRILDDLSKVCQDVKLFRSFCPKAYDQVLITDNDNIYQASSKDTFLFLIFKFLYQFAFIKYLLDLHGKVEHIWQAVLHIDEIIDRKMHIYVEDTLILNCDSITAYRKIIPFISGPYTRLILYGNISWQQLKWLTHPGVKNICIKATIQIPAEEYNDFAEFVVSQVRDSNFCFTIYFNQNLVSKLREACIRHKRLLLSSDENYIYIATFFYLLLSSVKHLFLNIIVSCISTGILFSILYMFGLNILL